MVLRAEKGNTKQNDINITTVMIKEQVKKNCKIPKSQIAKAQGQMEFRVTG